MTFKPGLMYFYRSCQVSHAQFDNHSQFCFTLVTCLHSQGMFKEISHFKGLCTNNADTEPSCYILFDHELFSEGFLCYFVP